MFHLRQALIRGVDYLGSLQPPPGSSGLAADVSPQSTADIANLLKELAARGIPNADTVAQRVSAHPGRQNDSGGDSPATAAPPKIELSRDEIDEILAAQEADGSWRTAPECIANGSAGAGDPLATTATCLRALAEAIPPITPHADLERCFWRDGYFVVKNFLTPADIDQLAHAHHDVHGTLNEGFYTSWFQPTEARVQTDRQVRAVMEARLRALFPRHRMIFGTFMSKGGEGESAFPLHQDPTFVDEREWSPLTFWAPLIDVDEENGCLLAVQGSHLISGDPRLSYAEFPYADHADRLKKEYLQPIPMQAGDMLIFHPALIHASPPNLTGRLRIAAAGAMVPEPAQVHFYRGREDGDNVIDVYAVDDAFYLGVGADAALSDSNRVAELNLPRRPFDIDRLPRPTTEQSAPRVD